MTKATTYILKKEGCDFKKTTESAAQVSHEIRYVEDVKDIKLVDKGWTLYLLDTETLEENLVKGLRTLFDINMNLLPHDVFVFYKRYENKPGKYIYSSRLFKNIPTRRDYEDFETPLKPFDPKAQTEVLLDGFIVGH